MGTTDYPKDQLKWKHQSNSMGTPLSISSKSSNSSSSPEALPLLAGQGLPDFGAITPDQVEQAIPHLLAELNGELTELETRLDARIADASPLGWAEVMDPVQHLGERLRWSWGVVSHLNGVCNTPELRTAHQQQQGNVVAFGNRAGQSRSLYRALQALDQ